MAYVEDIEHTPQDVAESLNRLVAVTAGKPLSFPENTFLLSPEDLQARWQIVAAATSSGLDAGSLEQLQVIYNYIEAIIISCGAPDSFDVYEACFESLTKIGFCVRWSPDAQAMLLKLMEDVHEVYDVLLSCVETYEWVQPGATGQLRLWMLQMVFVCFGSQAIGGRELMELTDNDVSGTVSLIAFILRCDKAPFDMQATAARCLVELTTADCVFLTQNEELTDDWQSQQIAKLTAMLNRHVNGLIKGLIQFEVVETFGRCICQHQMSHIRTDIIVKHFLTTVHNCLLYCSENQKKLRQHLATQSTIVQDIMIPYVANILPALFDNSACGPAMIEWQNLKSALQTFVVVTFNINVFRPQLRDSDMLLKVCQVPGILKYVGILELLVKIAVNVDFVKGPYYDPILQTLAASFQALTPELQVRLQRRLTSEQSMRLPFSVSNTQSREALAFAIAVPQGEETQDAEAVEARKTNRKSRWRNMKNKAAKRRGLFAMQKAKRKSDKAANASAEPAEAEEEDEDDEDDDEDMPPLIPVDGWETHLGPTDEAGVPSAAKCQLSGAFLHDPVSTPEGHVFERAHLEDWTTQYGTNPVTGQPLNVLDCPDATNVQALVQGYQLQALSACHIAPDAFDEPPTAPEIDPPTKAAVPSVQGGPSLLGDLPALVQEKKEKKAKSKIRIESRSVVECPDDMRCAIDGKVAINPVRSPYGHLFEQKTLDRWMKNCGSVCPVTQQPLRLEDCQPDQETKRRIVKFLKGQSD